MNSVYKMNENQKGFDFTAMRIFFSVIAILLSVTMPNALAVTDNSTPSQPSILDKIIVDLKNQQIDSIWRPEEKRANCSLQGVNPLSNQNSYNNLNFGSDFTCPASGSNKKPNES